MESETHAGQSTLAYEADAFAGNVQDAGTGIQPFLPPVASSTTSLLPLYTYKTFASLLALVRAVVLALLLVVWGILVGIPYAIFVRIGVLLVSKVRKLIALNLGLGLDNRV